MELGVCYYPEQWPQAWWADDAQRMHAMGIRWVRIAEFAWQRIEPQAGHLTWDCLDLAIETLHAAGLKVVMCTPTATPPKWLIDAHPDVLANLADGTPRGFGSRRHYCFSSTTYRAHAKRISEAVARRYGKHPAVQAWQTDNEYGCHDTVLSYSADARRAFRQWLAAKYPTVDALNTAWGAVFWSQAYASFDEIDPPAPTVTEANPSHRLDWQRFSSDQVDAFNREQCELIRAQSPGRPVSHNFMGFFTQFDHHKTARSLDIATWDSYPLGFTQMFFLSAAEKLRWARTAHPDIAGFHHDLYRGMCNGRWWVMEQQPGPVNWAHWNPAPQNGMVRLWTWQAFAHGAEVVSYFRWRQAPFAQEQMHAGLHRPDRSLDVGGREAMRVWQEMQATGLATRASTKVHAKLALVFDYESIWTADIQPHGADYSALEACFRAYSAARSLGLDVDVVSPQAELSGYSLIVLPAQLIGHADLAQRLAATSAQLVFGARAGSKTFDLQIPANLAPGEFAALTGVRVRRVESLPPGVAETFVLGSTELVASRWQEDLELLAGVAEGVLPNGQPMLVCNGRSVYAGTWLQPEGWQAVLEAAAQRAQLPTERLPDGLRISRLGPLIFAQNNGDAACQWMPAEPAELLLGSATVASCDIAIWRSAAVEEASS